MCKHEWHAMKPTRSGLYSRETSWKIDNGQGYMLGERRHLCLLCNETITVTPNKTGVPTGRVSFVPDKVEKALLAARPIVLTMRLSGLGLDLAKLEKVRKAAPALSLNVSAFASPA